MSSKLFNYARKLIAGVSAAALLAVVSTPVSLNSAFAQSATQTRSAEQIPTQTPIKHVILIVGENRSFDNVFATYQPKNGQTIWNLLSRGIVNADGSPGPNFTEGMQFQSTSSNGAFALSPTSKMPFNTLPVPTLDAAQAEGIALLIAAEAHIPPIINPVTGAGSALFPMGETELQDVPSVQILLTTGGPAQANPPVLGTIDTRLPNFNMLIPGPYPQTAPELPYDSYEGDTIHDLFTMWQQSDCSMTHATPDNPTGCIHDMYPFVATTYNTTPGTQSGDGGQDMAFYNMTMGDAPIFKMLADQFTIGDNFHESINSSSTPGAIAYVFADDVFWSDGNGNPLPAAQLPVGGLENVNPRPGTINEYTNIGGLVICSDPTQPGIAAIDQYLATLPYVAQPNCQPGAAYLIFNPTMPFAANGKLVPVGSGVPPLPPVTQRHVGDLLSAANIPWFYYGGGYNAAVNVDNGATDIVDVILGSGYCIQCNPFQLSTSVMSNPTAHLRDVSGTGALNNLFQDIAAGTLPPVSFVKPDEALDGHPGTSKLDLFENFVLNIVNQVQANPALWADTAILVSFDESGGLYDSGFIQPIDFFGDAPRMPLLVISPFSTGGKVSHSYTDQASVSKFIEHNWNLGKISNRSRDNLPNPIMNPLHPWVPINMPSIGDMFDMFDFTTAQIIQNDINNIEDELQQNAAK